ncbi:hypothetical protein [Halorarius halobius]|uniref:hypothetical protein n=1 Tax=Halorarius halobius TaxID=2962671 RepID=UPI0020CD3954|nr:hypothetical protein [Halorarius halobius]
MDRTFLLTVAAALLLLAGGVGAGVYLGGTGAFDQRPRVEPAVTGFSTGNASCVGTATVAPRVQVDNTTRGSFLILRANLTLADDRVPTNATIEEAGLANYTLRVTDEAGAVTACPDGRTAVAPVQVFFQVPHPGAEPFGVTVRYRESTLFRLRNGPEGLRVVNASSN